MAEDLVALVTGASSGIGAATARRLAQEPGARLVLVARREDRLAALAREVGGATVVAVDLTDAQAPRAALDAVAREHGRLDLLVNNAGAAWWGTFAEEGWTDVERHMRINFEAPVRLTEALLPVLRRTARTARRRVAIVNVVSIAARLSRKKSGGYSASKSALAGWSDALYGEEREHGVHVGLVFPGFIDTEGFPATRLRERVLTRWLVSSPERVAEAIVQVRDGKSESYVPRAFWLAGAARVLTPPLARRYSAATLRPLARKGTRQPPPGSGGELG